MKKSITAIAGIALVLTVVFAILYRNTKIEWLLTLAITSGTIAYIIASFVPIIASLRFGAMPVFIITSAAAAAIDLIFVIMQRYNRSRVVKLIERNKTWTMNFHMAE